MLENPLKCFGWNGKKFSIIFQFSNEVCVADASTFQSKYRIEANGLHTCKTRMDLITCQNI